MVSVDDVSRVFLQSIMSRRVVSDKLARILWEKSVEAVRAADGDVEFSTDSKEFDPFMNSLNKRLEPLDLKLSLTVDEVVKKKMWVMINLKGDLAQVATDYSPVEITYFKALVKQIVLASSECYSISSMTALREVSDLKPSMTKTQAEHVLANFVAKGWLLKSKRGRFSLSSRTLLELQTYLKDNYEDNIHECTVCFELVTKGVRCHIPACSARLHDHCYARVAREKITCPSCRADWSLPQKLAVIGEGTIKEGQDSRRWRDEEETDDTEEEPEPQPGPSKKNKATRAKGKQKYARHFWLR
ncbi:hypothetical protein K439DRAFT_1355770 [Ramaria rubella]|nr:hypothetical protein K439DRAFT_1355770 [Ramaria rubella]